VREPLVKNPAERIRFGLAGVWTGVNRLGKSQFPCSGVFEAQNAHMKRKRQTVHFGAAFLGDIPRAAIAGELPRAAQ